jgi:uncharacterized Zn finger protein
MPDSTSIASILHRSTIATIVGGRTFERGEQCFNEGRVLGVGTAPGELAGIVKPQDLSRKPYEIRIWVRDDGLAYACTCPMGLEQRFCKHAVAVAIAHFEKERERAEAAISGLREKLLDLSMNALLDGLIAHARADHQVAFALQDIVAHTSPS